MSDVISGFRDSFRLTSEANRKIEVARLEVPAGAYAIWAKLYLNVPLPDGLATTLRFRLQAGGDFDETMVTHDGILAFTSVALNVVHSFNKSGAAVLTAEHVLTSGDTELEFVKITAVTAQHLTNTRLG